MPPRVLIRHGRLNKAQVSTKKTKDISPCRCRTAALVGELYMFRVHVRNPVTVRRSELLLPCRFSLAVSARLMPVIASPMLAERAPKPDSSLKTGSRKAGDSCSLQQTRTTQVWRASSRRTLPQCSQLRRACQQKGLALACGPALLRCPNRQLLIQRAARCASMTRVRCTGQCAPADRNGSIRYGRCCNFKRAAAPVSAPIAASLPSAELVVTRRRMLQPTKTYVRWRM